MTSKNTKEHIWKSNILVLEEVSTILAHMFGVLECMKSVIQYYDKVKNQCTLITKKDGNSLMWFKE